MIQLPDNPTLADICRRSAILHPSLLAESLEAQYAQDSQLAATTLGISGAAMNARARACKTGADAVRSYDDNLYDWSTMPLGVQIVVAGEAAKLQCLPRHILTAAAIRTDESRIA